jgi:Cu2+-exporting ATPase
MATSPEACFHCGEPLPPAPPRARLGAREVAVCCAGCAAAAELIEGCGLDSYYRVREAAAPRPDAVRDAALAAYDRPALAERFVTRLPDGGRAVHMVVGGVRCTACAWLIEGALGRVAGVRRVGIDPVSARLALTLDADGPPLSAVLARLAALGFKPQPVEDAEPMLAAERRALLKRLAVAGLAAMQSMMYGIALWYGWWQGMDATTARYLETVSLLLATPVVLYSASPFFAGAWRQLRGRRLGMDVPVALAVALAYGASLANTLAGRWPVYYDSLSMFVFLLLAGRYLELAARARAGDAAEALARLLPRTAWRLEADGPRAVGSVELAPGDRVLVRPGEVVPADARLASDAALLDESLLTGESLPQHRARGAALLGGSLNAGAPFVAQVLRVGAGSHAAALAALLAQARAERPPLQLAADRIAGWLVAAVLLLASASAAWWWQVDPARALPVTLAVLVATCPCALGLALPAAHTAATHALARAGAFVVRSRALAALAATTDVVLDKTGTLTAGRPRLAGVELLRPGLTEERAVALAAALEHGSEHALARAFPPATLAVSEQRTVPGAGVSGVVGGVAYRLGTAAYCRLADAPGVMLADADGPLARFRFEDPLRDDALATVAGLRARGLAVHLLSGDDAVEVGRVAAALGITSCAARLAPPDKLARVRALQAAGRRVAMVGDGINDAPVLAGADLAVALCSGTALSQAQGDLVLTGARLAPLLEAFDLATRTRVVVRQNLTWAAGYNLLVLPVAALGLLAPWFAALGMSASSLLVVANALRLAQAPAPAGASAAARPAAEVAVA